MVGAAEVFEHVPEWHVVVCKQCQYAVWPTQITAHLTSQKHSHSQQVAQSIADEIAQWPGVIWYPSQFECPSVISQRIPQLPLFYDGIQCRHQPNQCAYIVRSMKKMKEHWRKKHQWSPQSHRGGSSAAERAIVEARIRENSKSVQCQRMFSSRDHSQYFEVRLADEASLATDAVRDSASIWESAWQQASEHYEQRRQEDVIRPGEMDEVNPWLRRTGWMQYLKDYKQSELLAAIRKPDIESTTPDEMVATAVWDAIRKVAVSSQAAVVQSGVMLRFEAIRTEMNQVQYAPLEAYRNQERVQEHCRPWQQMIMFFVRSQQDHPWKLPAFRFNRRQQRAFDRLMEAAQQQVESGDPSDSTDSEDDSDSEDDGDGVDIDDSPAHGLDHSPAAPDEDWDAVSAAALTFCVELLNQSMHSRETEMALVCALAVLGLKPSGPGFHDEMTFPSILSAIIKLAHFMVVRQAHRLGQEISTDEWAASCSPCEFDDSGYESETPAPQRRRSGRSSFEWVKKMQEGFMVRGSASPMHWMLDLRGYGLKVGFNTTREGYVGWRNGDVLEYKNIHFSMSQFRGMVDQLQRTTRKKLLDIMFAPTEQEVPTVPWRELFDDPSNASPGWSFVDDTRTPWPVDGQQWLFERIQAHPEHRQRFVNEHAARGINVAKVRDWMKMIDDFRGQLLVLMHITGGQPARGPEILSVRHSNTVQGRHRNVFIEDGLVVFVTAYHKGEQLKSDTKIIHRYLPREVGQLVVWYRWLVVPFVQRMRAWLWSGPAISDHLWGPDIDGRKWTTERMKGHLQRATAAGLGHPIHVAAYRHIAIAISRKWVRSTSAFTEDGATNDEADIADEQATHSAFTAGSVYAREFQEMEGSTASRRQQFRTTSVDWHRFCGFDSSIKDEVQRGMKRPGDPYQMHSKRARSERQERIRVMDAAADAAWMMRQPMTLRSVQSEGLQAIQRGDSKIVVVMPTGAGKSMLFMLPAFIGVGGVTIVIVPFLPLRREMERRSSALNISVGAWDRDENKYKAVDGKSIVFVTPEGASGPDFQRFVQRIRHAEQLDRVVIDECHIILGEEGGFRKGLKQLGHLASAHTQMLLMTATLPPSEEGQLLHRMFWQPSEVTWVRTSTVRPNIEYSVVDGVDEIEEQVGQLAGLIQPVVEGGGKAVVMCNDIGRIQEIVQRTSFPCRAFYRRGMSKEEQEQTFEAFRGGEVQVLIATSLFGTGIDIPDIRLVVHITMPDGLREYGQESGRGGRDGQFSQAIIVRGPQRIRDSRVQAYIEAVGCRRVILDAYLDGDEKRTQCRPGEAACDRCQVPPAPATPAPTAMMTPAATNPQGSVTPSVSRSMLRTPARPMLRTPAPTQSTSASPKWTTPPYPSHLPTPTPSSPLRRLVRADHERAGPDDRRREHVRDQRVWHEQLRERLHQWKNVCVLCQRHGCDHMHPISHCSQDHSQKANQERGHVQRSIQFPQSHVCYRCGVPRIICERWSEDGQARVPGADGKGCECQFYGIMVAVVYSIKHAHRDVWDRWLTMAKASSSWRGNVVAFLAGAIGDDEGYGCQIGKGFMWMTQAIEEG